MESSRGLNFTPDEDLALARSWVSASQTVTEQNADTFWKAVADIYCKQSECFCPRVHSSLSSRWTTIARTAQRFLAADKLYRSSIPSGEKEEDTCKNNMTLYRNKNKFKHKGELRTPGPVRFLSSIRLLSTCPKFYGTIGGSSTSSANYRPNSSKEMGKTIDGDVKEGQFASVSRSCPASSRPTGAKKRKAEEQVERNLCKVTKSVDAMTESIKGSAENKKMAASIALQLKILNRMCLSPSEMNEKLGKLMEQAALLGGFKTECVGPDDVGRVGNTPNSTNTLIGNTSSYQFTAGNDANIQVQDTSLLPATSGLSSSITNIGDADANENQNASSGALRYEPGLGRSPSRLRQLCCNRRNMAL